MRLDMRITGVVLGYGIPILIYWVGGGNFERNFWLALFVFIGSALAGLGFHLGHEWETKQLKKCLDKYRS